MKPPQTLSLSLVAGTFLLIGACQPFQNADSGASQPALATTLDHQGAATEMAEDEISEDIDALLAARVASDQPGVAVLVMVDGQILYAAGHGVSDVEAQTPITPATVFDLASVSKQMTAIALLTLVEQGIVGLDNPIRDYLPEWEDLDGDNPVLVSHLLHHTSGLADYTGDAWDGSEADFAHLDLEAHLTWLNDQAPLDLPGVAFEYNNSGYALLALIVQRASGQPFASFMETAIFAPAGMTQTLVYEQLGQRVPNQATGYSVDDNGDIELASFPSVIAGDGNVFSSLADLARYDTALRQGTLVSAKTLALAFAPGELADGSPIEDDEEDGESYGMGWQITPDYAHHSGSWLGTSTYYRHYFEPEISVIVLSNDEAFDTIALGEDIAERVLQ
jgi:CubicO group peptidase (beta-lactamase class C family)